MVVKNARVDFNVDDTPRSIRVLLDRLCDTGGVDADLAVDLRDCGYVGPAAIVVLVSMRRLAASRDHHWSLLPPTYPPLKAYCHYSGLMDEFGLAPTPPDYPETRTLPVSSFTGQFPSEAIGSVVAFVRKFMPLPPQGETDLTTILSELSQNVLDHAQSMTGGAVSARVYEKRNEVRFAIADTGRGIRASLGAGETDARAILSAVEQRRTARSRSNNLGMGLANVRGITTATRGSMFIVSGAGALEFGGATKWRPRQSTHRSALPGTLVFLRLPLRRIETPAAVELLDPWGD